jgi:hypothetical protein
MGYISHVKGGGCNETTQITISALEQKLNIMWEAKKLIFRNVAKFYL